MSEQPSTLAVEAPTETCELTVVMPCLNEAETLRTCIEKAQQSIAELGVVAEVVVADNGSTDGSQDIARAAGARVVDVPIRGYGAALRAGIDGARGQFVIMADADDSYALDDLGPFLVSLREGADLVMGNRFAGGIAPGAMPALHRYLGNPVLSLVGRRFFNIPVHDFHCGMRGFRRDRVIELGLRTLGMEFASEMVVRAALNAYDIREVPTTLRPDGRSRPPHLRTWLDGWRHLRFLLALSPRWALYYPSIALVVTGTVVFGWLLVGPHEIGGVSFDIHTLAAAATAIIVGVQLGGLALVSRAYCGHLGLLPTSSRIDRLLERFTLERGLLVGLAAVLVGIACFVLAVVRWEATDFGALDVGESMRVVMTGMVLIVTGMQVAAVSFMLSLVRVGEM
jgi:hypothetical protein